MKQDNNNNNTIMTNLGFLLKLGGQDLSKYTVSTSFVGIAVPRKVIGMLGVSAPPMRVVGIQRRDFQSTKCDSLC